MHLWLVNIFDEFPSDGEYDGRIVALGKALLEAGHTFTWWTSDWSHRYKRKRQPAWEQAGVSVITLPTIPYQNNVSLRRWWSHRAYAMAFRQAAREALLSGSCQRPERIYVNTPPPALSAEVVTLCREHDIESVVDIQDAWPESFVQLLPLKGIFKKVLNPILLAPIKGNARRTYAEADRVFAVSEDYLNIAKAYGCKRGKVVYIGAPSDRFENGPKSMERRGSNRLELVYIGGMSRSYDLDTLIHGLRLLPENTVRLHLAGYGERLRELEKLAKLSGVRSSIMNHGMLNQSDLRALLERCHIGINAVQPESAIAMPNKLGDYLSAALPILHSRADGELASLMNQHEMGIFYQAGDPKSFADAIKPYLADNKLLLLTTMSQNALTFAQNQLDREKTYPLFCNWLCDAIG